MIFQNILITKGSPFSANILTQLIFLLTKYKKPQVKLKGETPSKLHWLIKELYVNCKLKFACLLNFYDFFSWLPHLVALSIGLIKPHHRFLSCSRPVTISFLLTHILD